MSTLDDILLVHDNDIITDEIHNNNNNRINNRINNNNNNNNRSISSSDSSNYKTIFNDSNHIYNNHNNDNNQKYINNDYMIKVILEKKKKKWIHMNICYLCVFIFAMEFLPSEPFLFSYLIEKGLSTDEINNSIFPISAYVYVVAILFVGLLSHYLRFNFDFYPRDKENINNKNVSTSVGYRVAIFIGCFNRLLCRFLLLYGDDYSNPSTSASSSFSTVFGKMNFNWDKIIDPLNILTVFSAMQLSQVTWAISMASEVMFNSYIYLLVPHSYYQRATSYLIVTFLLSQVLCSILGDLLLYCIDEMTYHDLFIISIFPVLFACLWWGVYSMIQPFTFQEKFSKDFHCINEQEKQQQQENIVIEGSTYVGGGFNVNQNNVDTIDNDNNNDTDDSLTLQMIMNAVKKSELYMDLMIYCIWWIISNSVYMYLYNYEVSIYAEFKGDDEKNGIVSGIALLGGAFAAYIAQLSKWELFIVSHIQYIVLFGSLMMTIALGVLSFASSNLVRNKYHDIIIYPALLVYITFFMIWHFVNVIVTAEIARLLNIMICHPSAYNNNDDDNNHNYNDIVSHDDDDDDDDEADYVNHNNSNSSSLDFGLISSNDDDYNNTIIPSPPITMAIDRQEYNNKKGFSSSSSSSPSPPFSLIFMITNFLSILLQVILQAIFNSITRISISEMCYVLTICSALSSSIWICFIVYNNYFSSSNYTKKKKLSLSINK